MSTTVVNPPAAAPAAPAALPAAPATAPPDSAALQAQIDQLKLQAAEATRAAEFWHGKANAAPPAKEPPKEEDEPKEDILELAMDPKKFNKYIADQIKKQGYVKREDAEKLVNGKAAQISRETTLMKKYPDLEDHDSEMFKTTASRYGELVKNGVAEGIAMEMAAESAELQLIRAGKIKTPAEKAAAKEADRLARIAAQGGDRGGRSAGGDEEDTELDDTQKRIALGIMGGDTDEKGVPLTHDQIFEKYKARAKKGVQRFGKAA